MNNFHFTLSPPDAVLYDGDAQAVKFCTPDGEIGIMADHLPLVAIVSPGIMTIHAKGTEKTLATGEGFVKTQNNSVAAFAQTAEFAESIDEQRAREAKKEAEHIMDQKADEVSLADATALLERNIARLKVVEHKKKRSHH
jgi:F-type H+-transporting ATPase subunit epsilon